MAIELTDANFEELVLKSDKPAIVDLWAEWCGPCRMVGPLVEEMSKEYDGRAVIGKLDVDSTPEPPPNMVSGIFRPFSFSKTVKWPTNR